MLRNVIGCRQRQEERPVSAIEMCRFSDDETQIDDPPKNEKYYVDISK